MPFIEEAIGNAKKYAASSEILIQMGLHQGQLIAQVADKGPGFDVDQVKGSYDKRGSLGLLNMDERAKMIGGSTTIQSASGKGTTITVRIPFQQKEPN